MKIWMFVLLLPCMLSAQEKIVRKDVGVISDAQIVGARELTKLINENPGGDVFVLTFQTKLGNVVEKSALVYEIGSKKLGLNTESAMAFWRVWPGVEPVAFKYELPYGQKSFSDATKPGPFPLIKYLD